jgi:DNA invertase Pin-like site-specific DNA recombinase
MPLPKKLNCGDVKHIFDTFIGGGTVKSIAEGLGVTRLTVSRVLRYESYKDCTDKLSLPSDFFKKVDDMMKENQRRSRGQGKKVTA